MSDERLVPWWFVMKQHELGDAPWRTVVAVVVGVRRDDDSAESMTKAAADQLKAMAMLTQLVPWRLRQMPTFA